MLAAMRAFSSALGLSGLSTGWNAARNEANTNGQACRPPCRPLRYRQSSAKSLCPLGIEGKLADAVHARQMADQQIGPAFGTAAQSVELHGRFGVDARRANHQRQHAMPGLHVADQHAPCHRLRLVGAATPIVGTEHGRPHPREHFAGENLFQHAANLGPLVPVAAGRRRRPGRRSLFSRRAQRSSRTFEVVQYCSMLSAEIELPLRIKAGPWAETMAASSTSSRACMVFSGSKAGAEAKMHPWRRDGRVGSNGGQSSCDTKPGPEDGLRQLAVLPGGNFGSAMPPRCFRCLERVKGTSLILRSYITVNQ